MNFLACNTANNRYGIAVPVAHDAPSGVKKCLKCQLSSLPRACAMLRRQHRYSMQIMSRTSSLGNPLEILACKQRSPYHKIISHSSTSPLIFRLPRTPFQKEQRIYFLAFFGLAIGSSRILRISSSTSFLSVLDWYFSTSRAGAVASLVMPFLVMAEFQISKYHRFRVCTITYQWWSKDGQQLRCPCLQQPRTGGRRFHGHTQRHRPFQCAHHRAGEGRMGRCRTS